MIKEYYKQNNYKDYKSDKKKLSFENWWILTGLLEKEISYLEDQIATEKENGKYYDDTHVAAAAIFLCQSHCIVHLPDACIVRG